MDEVYFEVGRDKNGEIDFGVVQSVRKLSVKDMKSLRSMIIVGIGVLEDTWRSERDKLDNPQTKDG